MRCDRVASEVAVWSAGLCSEGLCSECLSVYRPRKQSFFRHLQLWIERPDFASYFMEEVWQKCAKAQQKRGGGKKKQKTPKSRTENPRLGGTVAALR